MRTLSFFASLKLRGLVGLEGGFIRGKHTLNRLWRKFNRMAGTQNSMFRKAQTRPLLEVGLVRGQKIGGNAFVFLFFGLTFRPNWLFRKSGPSLVHTQTENPENALPHYDIPD